LDHVSFDISLFLGVNGGRRAARSGPPKSLGPQPEDRVVVSEYLALSGQAAERLVEASNTVFVPSERWVRLQERRGDGGRAKGRK